VAEKRSGSVRWGVEEMVPRGEVDGNHSSTYESTIVRRW
jgi:hypothetical protein